MAFSQAERLKQAYEQSLAKKTKLQTLLSAQKKQPSAIPRQPNSQRQFRTPEKEDQLPKMDSYRTDI